MVVHFRKLNIPLINKIYRHVSQKSTFKICDLIRQLFLKMKDVILLIYDGIFLPKLMFTRRMRKVIRNYNISYTLNT